LDAAFAKLPAIHCRGDLVLYANSFHVPIRAGRFIQFIKTADMQNNAVFNDIR